MLLYYCQGLATFAQVFMGLSNRCPSFAVDILEACAYGLETRTIARISLENDNALWAVHTLEYPATL